MYAKYKMIYTAISGLLLTTLSLASATQLTRQTRTPSIPQDLTHAYATATTTLVMHDIPPAPSIFTVMTTFVNTEITTLVTRINSTTSTTALAVIHETPPPPTIVTTEITFTDETITTLVTHQDITTSTNVVATAFRTQTVLDLTPPDQWKGPWPDKLYMEACFRMRYRDKYYYELELSDADDGWGWCDGFLDNLHGRGCAITQWNCRPYEPGEKSNFPPRPNMEEVLTKGYENYEYDSSHPEDLVYYEGKMVTKRCRAHFSADLFCGIEDVKAAFAASSGNHDHWKCEFRKGFKGSHVDPVDNVPVDNGD